MEEVTYTISECAKKIGVETHVLRHWQDEVGLQIGRDEYGRRFYTSQDIEQIQLIKQLKDQGIRLKAIRNIIHGQDEIEESLSCAEVSNDENKVQCVNKDALAVEGVSLDEKMKRLQFLLKSMIHETVKEENREFCEEVKTTLIKELNYQFEKVEERERKRQERDEKHYRELDMLLREYQNNKKQEEKPIVHFSMLKKGKTV